MDEISRTCHERYRQTEFSAISDVDVLVDANRSMPSLSKSLNLNLSLCCRSRSSKLYESFDCSVSSASVGGRICRSQEWHAAIIRAQFPDDELLFTHPNRPKIVIRVFPTTCNGLHDRMSDITLFLYDAYKTNRVLLIKWYNRFELESFLMPAQNINWTLPHVRQTATVDQLLQQTIPLFQ